MSLNLIIGLLVAGYIIVGFVCFVILNESRVCISDEADLVICSLWPITLTCLLTYFSMWLVFNFVAHVPRAYFVGFRDLFKEAAEKLPKKEPKLPKAKVVS